MSGNRETYRYIKCDDTVLATDSLLIAKAECDITIWLPCFTETEDGLVVTIKNTGDGDVFIESECKCNILGDKCVKEHHGKGHHGKGPCGPRCGPSCGCGFLGPWGPCGPRCGPSCGCGFYGFGGCAPCGPVCGPCGPLPGVGGFGGTCGPYGGACGPIGLGCGPCGPACGPSCGCGFGGPWGPCGPRCGYGCGCGFYGYGAGGFCGTPGSYFDSLGEYVNPYGGYAYGGCGPCGFGGPLGGYAFSGYGGCGYGYGCGQPPVCYPNFFVGPGPCDKRKKCGKVCKKPAKTPVFILRCGESATFLFSFKYEEWTLIDNSHGKGRDYVHGKGSYSLHKEYGYDSPCRDEYLGTYHKKDCRKPHGYSDYRSGYSDHNSGGHSGGRRPVIPFQQL